MKLSLTADLVLKMSLTHYPFPGEPDADWPKLTEAKQAREEAQAKAANREWTPRANYLIYDEHRDAPVGFGVRVGKKASVFSRREDGRRQEDEDHVGLAKRARFNAYTRT